MKKNALVRNIVSRNEKRFESNTNVFSWVKIYR